MNYMDSVRSKKEPAMHTRRLFYGQKTIVSVFDADILEGEIVV